METLWTLYILQLLISVRLVICCDINKCINNTTSLMLPNSCNEYTKQLQCIKKEMDSCKTGAERSAIMMSSYFTLGASRGAFCGFDMSNIQTMMTARVGLMTSMFNLTGPGLMMMGDDGPFDDGPFDDGPFDDGPFDDDGPFGDDGPFDDMGENGFMHPGLLLPGLLPGGTGVKGTTAKPPQAPGLLPRFRGGAAMHYDDGKNEGRVSSMPSGMVVFIIVTVIFL